MDKLYVDNWFKLPPKGDLKKTYIIKPSKKGTGKKRAKLRQKTKK